MKIIHPLLHPFLIQLTTCGMQNKQRKYRKRAVFFVKQAKSSINATRSNPVTSTTSSPNIGYNLGEVLFYHQNAQKPCYLGAFEPSLFLGVG